MEISNNTNSILNSNLNTNISTNEEQKDRFDIFLENREKQIAEKQKTKLLLEDLDFVAKTGFTKEQLDAIKELLEKLQKQRAELGQAPLNPEEYIQALKQDLQTAIYEITGKKVDLDNEALQAVMNLQNNISNESFVKPTTHEELKLQDRLKKELV